MPSLDAQAGAHLVQGDRHPLGLEVLEQAPEAAALLGGGRGGAFTDQVCWSSRLVLAKILTCHWLAECTKLRAVYSKPVVGYIGFLLLNDPAVGKYHAWFVGPVFQRSAR